MSATDTFISTLTQTPQEAAALLIQLNKLDSNLGQIITVLGYSKTVDDDLTKLDNALTTVQDVLDVVTVIPEVGEAASAFKNAVTALSQEVHPARQSADKIEAKVKPLRDALQSVDNRLKQLIGPVQTIQTDSRQFLAKFTTVVTCIRSLPDGSYKTTGETYLDQFSSTAQPEVSGLNTGMTTATNAITTFYNALARLQQQLSPLSAIASAVNQVLGVLNPVISVLQQLQNDLQDIKITIPIPYPMNVSLYDIFKDFGEFINLALAPIQSLVNEALSALHVTLPSIPGLSNLINLNITIPGLPDFEGLLTPLEGFLKELEAAIPKFNLQCPPPK